jgi:thiol-disulfide isomerase/thioredoxin
MKKYFYHAAVFVVLAIGSSSLTSCSGDSDTTNIGAGNTAVSNPSPEKSKAPSEYPPLPEKIAQADLAKIDGTPFKIADQKGKVLLLNMWATWCGPCRYEMPHLVAMQTEHNPKGFDVVGLNIEENDTNESITKFAADMAPPLNYPLVRAESISVDLTKLGQSGAIPTSFVVDRNGHLRGVFRGAGAPEVAKMKELVAKVVAEEN